MLIIPTRPPLILAYKPKGIILNGTNNYYSRGAALTGVAATASGLVSFWYTLQGSDGATLSMMTNTSNRVQIYRDNTNRFVFTGNNVVGTNVLNVQANNTFVASAGTWHHFLACWNLAASPTFQFYHDDVSQPVTVSALTASQVINYPSGANWTVGADVTGVQFWNGYLLDYWFDINSILDLSVVANRRKFITSGLKPVNLGATGNIPTGSTPIYYQHVSTGSAASAFATNLGTGGGMTANGTAIALAPTSP